MEKGEENMHKIKIIGILVTALLIVIIKKLFERNPNQKT